MTRCPGQKSLITDAQSDSSSVAQNNVNVLTRSAFLLFLCQDLLAAVSNPPPGKHSLQEEDLQGRFHRHLQPRGPAHRLRAARGERHDAEVQVLAISKLQTRQHI